MHELTVKVFDSVDKNYQEKIITSWLREKANEIAKHFWGRNLAKFVKVSEILGLTEAWEKESMASGKIDKGGTIKVCGKDCWTLEKRKERANDLMNYLALRDESSSIKIIKKEVIRNFFGLTQSLEEKLKEICSKYSIDGDRYLGDKDGKAIHEDILPKFLSEIIQAVREYEGIK